MRFSHSIAILLFPFVLTACQQASDDPSVEKAPSSEPRQASLSCAPAERVDVVHFHAFQQCVSCIAVGRLAKETLEERFAEEMKSGRVVFRDINGEIPENSAIVTQYQARGSSLFVNAVSQSQNHIEEDATVWRLTTNEEQYKQYFEQKIRNLLTCSS